ncbi:flavin reductase [Alteromonas sp. KUL49]|uniref:flavin reductase family protein n=1 Tax=Alteromonas sp. KUL49 TaxID=2480798 RepID=UPI00102F2603|nr:flavin reductase [Alteromonas sp. KUL49]TAP42229.1 flavin oxidoreductase [Alteromonas sp. KUL49]GEA09818.1 flavin oxidoreductase [Alteromonas sp. KUL49]
MDNQEDFFDRSRIEQMPQRFRANFINSLSGFKSASLLGTSNGTTANLAVISSVVHVGANPPLLGVVMRPHTVRRDSLENIKNTGSYTLNHIGVAFTDKAHQTSARYEKDESEFYATGLTPWYSESFSAPYVKESSVKIGLTVTEHFTLCNDTEFVVGEIKEVFLSSSNKDALKDDGYIDIASLGSACISGLDTYHSTQHIAKYSYAKPDSDLAKMS